MYCPSCGLLSSQGLNYCKGCGANLNSQGVQSEPERVKIVISFPLVILFLAIAFVAGIVPMGMVTNLYSLKEAGINSNQLAVLLGLTAFVGLGAVGLLVWLLLKLVGVTVFESKKVAGRSIRTSELQPPKAIPAPPDLMPSVTEHTTRTFDRTRVRD